MPIDKVQVARQFSRAAVNYSDAAVVQNQMADDLFDSLPLSSDTPARIADLGCGTGYLTEKLLSRYLSSEVIGLDIASGMLHEARYFFEQSVNHSRANPRLLQADIESLPLADNICDLVVSNAALQWTNFENALQEVARILVPGGTALIGTFAEGTLQEWHQALDKLGLERSHKMPSQKQLESCIEKSNLTLLQTNSISHLLRHDCAQSLLKSTKTTGATNALVDRSKGLMGKQSYSKLITAIEEEFENQEYYSRYCAVYFVLRKL